MAHQERKGARKHGSKPKRAKRSDRRAEKRRLKELLNASL
jgi:hypothetical protein